MNTFTKTLIASAMAVAVAGTASADPQFAGVYAGSKTNFKVTPAGCPNENLKNQTTAIGFSPAIDFIDVIGDPGSRFSLNIPFAGCWRMTGLGGLISPEEFDSARGSYIERKPGKDLTMALTFLTLEDIVDAMDFHLVTEGKCDVSLVGVEALPVKLQGVDPLSVILKKGNGKLSKNGERIKVDIQIDAKYDSSDKSDRNIKAKINGKMDFNPTGTNPVGGCFDAILDEGPLPG